MKINSQYSVKITEDGSPTLVLSTGVDHLFVEEKMHSRFGAASETEYIYGPAIDWAFEKIEAPRFIVVGLGLGYIEFLISRQGRLRNSIYEIHSFESDPFLRDSILAWLHEDPNDLDPVFCSALTSIAGRELDLQVKEDLRSMHEKGKWRISGAISPEAVGTPANGILYDLFSHKITPELWNDQFISSLLQKAAAKECSFASYASKGAIKRSLKTCGFTLVDKKGFAGKRESTLAFRTVF